MCEVFGRAMLWLYRSMSFSKWMDILKLVGAVAAFWIGLKQYRKSETWKRVQFVADEMKTFYDDPAVKLAMGMLDWRKKEVALFKYRGGKDIDERVVVDYALVATALGIDPELKYDKNQSAIREIFERFLEFLARFEGFLETGVVKKGDLDPYLDYWTKLIAGRDANSPEVAEQVLPHLWRFIDHYRYHDVRRFVGRYETVAFQEFRG
jgi:hypothetical protein